MTALEKAHVRDLIQKLQKPTDNPVEYIIAIQVYLSYVYTIELIEI